jgi:hypothetical protein
MNRILATIVATLGLVYPSLAMASDYLCCNMLAPGSTCVRTSPPPGTPSENVCPQPGPNGWITTIALTSAPGGARVGNPIVEPPFDGLCLVYDGTIYDDYQEPDLCVPIIRVGTPVTTNFPDHPVYYGIDLRVITKLGVNLEGPTARTKQLGCYSGGSALRYATKSFGNYQCTQPNHLLPKEWNSQWVEDLFGPYVPGLNPPPLLGTVPHLAGPSTAEIGESPVFNITHAYGGHTVRWEATFNGQPVSTVNELTAVTSSDGKAQIHFPMWQAIHVGLWTRTAIINGFRTNTVTYRVQADPLTLRLNNKWIGAEPIYQIANAPPNALVDVITFRDGVAQDRHGTLITNPLGGATWTGPAWTASDLGQWTEYVVVNGITSNQLTYVVTASMPPQPVPALPTSGLLLLGGGLAVAGIIRRRKGSGAVDPHLTTVSRGRAPVGDLSRQQSSESSLDVSSLGKDTIR